MKLKTCEACLQAFECNAENVYECQCYLIQLNSQQKETIANQFTDCLCNACLTKIITEKPLD